MKGNSLSGFVGKMDAVYESYKIGGERGIRTLGGLLPTAVFETAALGHSAISPLMPFNIIQKCALTNGTGVFFVCGNYSFRILLAFLWKIASRASGVISSKSTAATCMAALQVGKSVAKRMRSKPTS